MGFAIVTCHAWFALLELIATHSFLESSLSTQGGNKEAADGIVTAVGPYRLLDR